MSNNDYLAHYGKLGMHWGIRRYQPYPSSYTGDGRFLGKKERTPEDEQRRTEKKATKQLKKIARLDHKAEKFKKRVPLREYRASRYKYKVMQKKASIFPTTRHTVNKLNKKSARWEYRAAKDKMRIPRIEQKAAKRADKFITQYKDINISTLNLNDRQLSSAKKYIDAAIERSKRGY